jgi:hypothetical protein
VLWRCYVNYNRVMSQQEVLKVLPPAEYGNHLEHKPFCLRAVSRHLTQSIQFAERTF